MVKSVAIILDGGFVLKNSKAVARSRILLQKLAARNYVAVRKGRLAFRGWTIKKFTLSRLQEQAVSQRSLSQQLTAAASEIQHEVCKKRRRPSRHSKYYFT